MSARAEHVVHTLTAMYYLDGQWHTPEEVFAACDQVVVTETFVLRTLRESDAVACLTEGVRGARMRFRPTLERLREFALRLAPK